MTVSIPSGPRTPRAAAAGAQAEPSLVDDWIFARRHLRPGGRGATTHRASLPRVAIASRELDPPPDPEAALARGVREAAPLRRVLCALAGRVLETQSWSRLGFARARDYATERAGVSLRSLQELARVGRLLEAAPGIEAAFQAGGIGWTRLRALARLGRIEDEALWLGRAKALSLPRLERAVRAARAEAAGRGEVVPGRADAGDDEDPVERVPVACAPAVRAKWAWGCELARRVAGGRLPLWECGEVMAAELSSALAIDPEGKADLDETVARGTDLGEVVAVGRAPGDEREALCAPSLAASQPSIPEASPSRSPDPPPPDPLSPDLTCLLDDLDEADAFELDRRLRRALALERSREARLGPPLRAVIEGRRYRWRGYWDRDRYLAEHLGLCPRKARALVRIERVLEAAPALAPAYRTGALSWVQAQSLAPLVEAGVRDAHAAAWGRFAQRVSVRRIEDEVRGALALADTDPAAFARTGGLPEEIASETWTIGARAERTIGARETAAGSAGPRFRKIRAPRASAETATVAFHAPPESARFFRTVLTAVQRRLEGLRDGPVSEGTALEALLDHVIRAWGERDAVVRREHRILERDGFRCAVPGCSSHANLQVHHVVFRSQGGGDEPENLVTLCTWHHQRGIHGGRVRCTGRAPRGLRFELGLRDGHPPLVVYEPGEHLG
jgi:HNH endonuclease